jgi:hypothetical protein
MAAPDLTKRSACFVAKLGTDDAGYNPVGAPQARLTIAAALADLAANYPTASATAPQVVSLEPGTYTTPAFALPPFTWVIGNPDGPTDPTHAVIVSLTGNITLSTAWQTNQTATGGLIGLMIRQTTSQTIDLTMPTPAAGNPTRVITLRDLRTDVDAIVWQATSTADALHCEFVIQDGNTGDAIGFTDGTVRLKNCSFAATVTHTSGATIGLTLFAVTSPSAVLILTKGASALTATLDAVSVPIRSLVTLNGGAVFTRSNDANGDAYSPTTPANWTVVPATVQEALDTLGASSGGGGTGTFAYIVRTGNRSSAAWGTSGVAINDTVNTFTDTSSVAGPVATVVARSFGIPTFTSAVAVVFTNAANVYIAGDPVAGGAAAITNSYGFWNVGKTRVDGGIYFGGTTPGTITGTLGAITITTAGTNQNIALTTSGTGRTVLTSTASASVPWLEFGTNRGLSDNGAALYIVGNGVSNARFDGTTVQLYGNGNAGFSLGTSINVTLPGSSVASTANFAQTGTWFTGGSGTTNKPHFLIEPTGTASTNWSTSGTGIGVNATNAFAGVLLELQVNAVRNFAVLSGGTIVTTGSLNATSGNINAIGGTFSGAVTAYSGTAIPAGGTAGKGFLISSTANFGMFFGSGAPTLISAKGSIFLRSDGSGVNDRCYVATDSAGTWTPFVTVA